MNYFVTLMFGFIFLNAKMITWAFSNIKSFVYLNFSMVLGYGIILLLIIIRSLLENKGHGNTIFYGFGRQRITEREYFSGGAVEANLNEDWFRYHIILIFPTIIIPYIITLFLKMHINIFIIITGFFLTAIEYICTLRYKRYAFLSSEIAGKTADTYLKFNYFCYMKHPIVFITVIVILPLIVVFGLILFLIFPNWVKTADAWLWRIYYTSTVLLFCIPLYMFFASLDFKISNNNKEN